MKYTTPNPTSTTSFNAKQFVEWFQQVSPYIHAHRGRIFVISFDGVVVQHPNFHNFIHDIALLNSLGIRLVLVHGIRPQIDHCLQLRGITPQYFQGLRITDEIALNCVKAACGVVRSTIESCLSMGLTNFPVHDAVIRTASGNFVIAKPVGIREGVDFCYTGEVRRIDITAINRRLDEGSIVLISPIGYSPTGESFNILTEDVATEVAIALKATKWICLLETPGIEENNQIIRQLSLVQAQTWLTQHPSDIHHHVVNNAVKACQNEVTRVHLVPRSIEGNLLLELFTRDGVGTLVSNDLFDYISKATIEDLGGLLELLQPLEEAGILVRRSREKLEMEIDYFTIQKREGMVIACAALYPFFEESMAELACLAVHPSYRRSQRGEALLAFLEQEAKQLGIKQLFVLTTHTAHWFQERGFVAADLEALPMSRRALYNYQRRSKVFIKQLNLNGNE